MTNARRFELSDGASNKFWEVALQGDAVTTRYGRIGSAGQVTTKEEANATAAQKLVEKLIREKPPRATSRSVESPHPLVTSRR